MKLHDLWGATLDGIALDLNTQSVTLRVGIHTGGRDQAVQVVSSGVAHLEFSNAIKGGTWDYTEITEAFLEDGGRRLHLVLWSEASSLIIEADVHEFEDGTGRHRLTG
jgi:hypothetical protein